MHRCSFMASIRGRHPFSTSLSSHGIIVGFFRRDNRFAALLERYAHLSWPTLREFYAGGKVCFSLSLSLSVCRVSANDVSRINPRETLCVSIDSNRREEEILLLSRVSINSLTNFNYRIVVQREKKKKEPTTITLARLARYECN